MDYIKLMIDHDSVIKCELTEKQVPKNVTQFNDELIPNHLGFFFPFQVKNINHQNKLLINTPDAKYYLLMGKDKYIRYIDKCKSLAIDRPYDLFYGRFYDIINEHSTTMQKVSYVTQLLAEFLNISKTDLDGSLKSVDKVLQQLKTFANSLFLFDALLQPLSFYIQYVIVVHQKNNSQITLRKIQPLLDIQKSPFLIGMKDLYQGNPRSNFRFTGILRDSLTQTLLPDIHNIQSFILYHTRTSQTENFS